MTSPPLVDSHPATPWSRWPVVAAFAAVAAVGANQLAFLCDDAYIHFRYASNLHNGLGIVWNAEPFEPVEGAGFLWVSILATIWTLFGVAPPESANVFSIACGMVQLALLAAALLRLRRRDGGALPTAVLVCALLAIVGNRTFLQWLSSGLDTALFNMWLFWWTLHAFRRPGEGITRWLAIWSLAAALATMTRPDGLPLTCATAGIGGFLCYRGRASLRQTLVGLSPLLMVAALTLWRRAYYGEWLPNTYYAKVVAAWPEAGARYFACFALENGAWLWFVVVLLWLGHELRRPLRTIWSALLEHAPAAAAIAVVLFNACYYLFKVGGDHFEYRVLSPLAPLAVVACVAMATRVSGGSRLPIAASLSLLLFGSVGWAHLAWTSNPTYFGVRAVTPAVPSLLKPIARWYDRQQLWLFTRFIGLRCVHHDLVLQVYRLSLPERQPIATAEVPFPTYATGAVGLPGWVMPDCAIIDEFGLNDWVIARGPLSRSKLVDQATLVAAIAAADTEGDGLLGLIEIRHAYAKAFGTNPEDGAGDFALRFLLQVYEGEQPGVMTAADVLAGAEILRSPRRMAHERLPPPGYVQAFEANVIPRRDGVTLKPRATPLTAERIRSIEAEWRERVRRGQF